MWWYSAGERILKILEEIYLGDIYVQEERVAVV